MHVAQPVTLDSARKPQDEDDEDIADVAVGESHILLATFSGRVFAIGANSNGQLGSLPESVESWTRLELNLPEWVRAVQLVTGPRNSLIVTESLFA